jgi:hypothetical protein
MSYDLIWEALDRTDESRHDSEAADFLFRKYASGILSEKEVIASRWGPFGGTLSSFRRVYNAETLLSDGH